MMPMTCRARHISGVISTDDIIPGRYKHMYTDTAKLAEHVFENRFPGLAATFRKGDLVIADDTYGIGSSREQAVSSQLAAGIRAVVAPRFGRIFFRNCWNLGLLAIEADATSVPEDEEITLDVGGGCLAWSSGVINFLPPPAQMIETVESGGLLRRVAARLHSNAA